MTEASTDSSRVGHTPGPWQKRDGIGQYAVEVVAKNKRGKDFAVARVSSGADTRDADGLLIAAAPALLAACDAAYRILGDIHHHWKGRDSIEGQGALSDLRDAISAATGREGQEVQDHYALRT